MISTEPTSAAWDEELLKNPHAVGDKRTRVRKMFAAIAPSYDLNNRLHSMGVDQLWRRRAVRLAALKPRDVIVDVACGTGDLSIKFAEALRESIRPGQVTGIDFTYEMLPIAKRKWQENEISTHRRERSADPNRGDVLGFINGDALALPLPDACSDVVSIAFGIRNVADPQAALREFRRILRPGGRLIILEFSLPTNAALRGLYNFYFRKILPRTATFISGDKTGAYKYLPESVNTFIGREQMIGAMQTAGFEQVDQFPMTFGVCVCYRGLVRECDSQG